ncbi:hypothetical protein [Roseivirga spongicola]|uniref:Uncharacterized protein n=1 Tax=Roseivirga spongicola TaxID=333140 RepID=A0A150XCE3_9BACT|nr:hypothetical protein [Roseivirga spongicola]KYG76393.1 hypothetical protein AWW68_19585 [Roseivirga spongicola]WPZ08771.1 hypothetical protein T7867_10930 [Roseivirga spongicola]
MTQDEDIWMGIGDPVEDNPEEAIENQVEEVEFEEEQPEQEEPQEQPSEEPEQEEVPDIIASLREEGYEVNSKEELVSALKEKARLEQEFEGVRNSLKSYEEDEEVKTIRAFREAGEGDLQEYLRLKKADYEKMSDEDVLWEDFKLKNKEDLEDYGEKFVRKAFQDKLKSYSVVKPDFVDEDEEAEWERNNKEDIEFSRLKKSGDIKKARKSLMERKEKYAVLPAPTQQKDADVQENLKQFGSNVQNALKDFQPVKISISDNEGESFNLAADDSVKSQVESIAKDPQELLSLVGIKEDGSFDFNTMLQAATVLTHVKNGTLGKHLAEHALTVKNTDIVERKLENPTDGKTKVNAGSKNELVSFLDEMGY